MVGRQRLSCAVDDVSGERDQQYRFYFAFVNLYCLSDPHRQNSQWAWHRERSECADLALAEDGRK